MLARALALMFAAGTLTACGTGSPSRPPANSAGERQWLDNASGLVGTLETGLLVAANGGDNVATARRALGDQSVLYSLLVAYTLFGDCSHALGNVGTPSTRERQIVATLVATCRRLERASALFEQAVKQVNASDPPQSHSHRAGHPAAALQSEGRGGLAQRADLDKIGR